LVAIHFGDGFPRDPFLLFRIAVVASFSRRAGVLRANIPVLGYAES